MNKAYSYIRFSSKEQAKGDSLERQTEAAKEYAQANGLVLDTSLNMHDLGISAFKGKHKTKGALGNFLRLVEAGKIEKGSILIIENFDRLSRENASDALPLFLNLINSGIELVTLDNKIVKKFTKQSVDSHNGELYQVVGAIERANAESKRKSELISHAKAKHRENALSGLKITRQTPKWMYLTDDRSKFILIEDRVKAVQLIFKYRLAGDGLRQIMHKLNADKILWKPERRGENSNGGWYISYINNILRNPAVYGAFQLSKMKFNKEKDKSIMTKDGEPIPDYFPAIVDKAKFDQVQTLLSRNKALPGCGGGRKDKGFNLFVHIAKCGLCGSSLIYKDHSKHENWKYLACSKKMNLKQCDARNIRYEDLENLFFSNFEEMDLKDLMPKEKDIITELQEVKQKHLLLSIELEDLQRQINNGTNTLLNQDSAEIRDLLIPKLSELKDKLILKEKELQNSSKRINELNQQDNVTIDGVNNLLELKQVFDNTKTEEELTDLRYKIRHQIQTLVEHIKVYPREDRKNNETIIDGNIRATKIYRTLDSAHIKLRNNVQVRMLFATDYRHKEDTGTKLVPNRIDRKPKYQ